MDSLFVSQNFMQKFGNFKQEIGNFMQEFGNFMQEFGNFMQEYGKRARSWYKMFILKGIQIRTDTGYSTITCKILLNWP